MPAKLKKITKPVAAAVAETPAPVAKKVTRVAPPADVKAAAKTKAEPKAAKPSRNISLGQHPGTDGVLKHMRIAEFQDYTLSVNGKARLTDTELIALWQKEFPNAVTFTEHHVRGVRRDYNAGRHDKRYNGKKTGDAVSVPFMIKDGKRIPATLENAPAKDTAKSAKAAKSAAA
jgi:hypothetical protein